MTDEEILEEVQFLLSRFDADRPPHEKIISNRFARLAHTMAGKNRILPHNVEVVYALRKLLEARDAALLSLYRL